ncbi:MAG: hypothetical protein M4579_003598 [Chaenotheca gracillima]|nr:MAG: hypothetical protein M4579_003598 [Chaenotheca gracillima]
MRPEGSLRRLYKGVKKPPQGKKKSSTLETPIFYIHKSNPATHRTFSKYLRILPSSTTNMKTAFLTLALASLGYGYVVTVFSNGDCTGASTTLDLASSGDCSGVPAGSSVTYQSDIGCVLSTYSDAGCGGEKAVTRVQNSCFAPGYSITGVICA